MLTLCVSVCVAVRRGGRTYSSSVKMTVITKSRTESKPLVKHEVEGGECVVVDGKAAEAAAAAAGGGVIDEEVWVPTSARCRASTATSVCVSITALLIMSIGIIGGVYLYRQLSAHERTRFRGWCGIPYDRSELLAPHKLPLGGNPAVYRGGRHGVFKDTPSVEQEEQAHESEWITKSLLKEEFELDLENNDHEEIHVPDFGFRRQGRFIHDFIANKTGIIDFSSHRCYVMPLDSTHVLPPRSLYDLIKKIWMGYYSVDTQVVKQKMQVVGPPIKDYQPLGVYIARYCSSYPTYNLERIYVKDVKKRSVDPLGGEEDEGIQFAEFAGKNIVHFIILGTEEEEEKNNRQ